MPPSPARLNFEGSWVPSQRSKLTGDFLFEGGAASPGNRAKPESAPGEHYVVVAICGGRFASPHPAHSAPPPAARRIPIRKNLAGSRRISGPISRNRDAVQVPLDRAPIERIGVS